MSLINMLDKSEHIEKTAFRFLIDHPDYKIGLFGAGGIGFYLYNYLNGLGFHVDAFIDDNENKQNNKYCGLPILSYEKFISKYPKHIIFISIASGAIDAMKKLKEVRNETSIFYIGSRDPYTEVTDIDFIKRHEEEYENALKLFKEPFSKKVFVNILNNKLTGKYNYASDIITTDMYFDADIISLMDNEVFADVGAYDGTNSIQFANLVNRKYNQILAFEPDPKNISLAKNNFIENNIINAKIFQKALSNKKELLHFTSDLNCVSGLCDTDTGYGVEALTLDSLPESKSITFIKMDIEGGEKNALLGAKNLIQTKKPKLAVSIYHKREDFYELPLLIAEMNPDYKFYLRHYTDTAGDTVLYAV